MLARNGSQLNIASGIRTFGNATPDAIAVRDGARQLTFGELDRRTNRAANALLAAGLQPGARVGLLMGNRAEHFEVIAALGKAGMVMVPLNPRLTAVELGYIAGHAGVTGLILDNAYAHVASGVLGIVPIRTVLSVDGTDVGPAYEAAVERARATDPSVFVDETQPFVAAYTSGTTGKPKGVLISHRSRSLLFQCIALEFGLGPGMRTLGISPMYYGAGLAYNYGPVCLGATTSVLRSFDPELVLAVIEADRPNSVFFVPTQLQMIRALGEDTIRRYDTSSLRVLYVNAAPMPQELKEWTLQTFPTVGLYEVYGSTESGIVSVLRPPDQLRKQKCVGPAWFMNEVRLIDVDGAEVGPGGVGELFSRSPFLMNGYLDDPEATEAATTPDGFFSAGDIARMDEDRYLYIVDRKKDMIISGGINVYSREVEEVLLRHPAILDAAVVGGPSEKWGEEVSAFVVVAGDEHWDVQAFDAHCRASLAGFKVPRRYERVAILPRNANGKILKRDLRDRLARSATMPA